MTVIENVLEDLLEEYAMCTRCMGRAFGRKKSSGVDITLRDAQTLPKELLARASESCDLCNGVVNNTIDIVDSIKDTLIGYEFNTFLVGVKIAKQYSTADSVFTDRGIKPLNLKFEVSRELGLRIGEALNKEVEFNNPDLRITIECRASGKIRYTIEPTPLFVLGKYRKLIRGIPQTKWPCGKCRGRGCESCEFSGLQYRESVESVVAAPLLLQSKARDESFHGAGREDIDALMLGTGRPFVLELKNPRKRALDLIKAEDEINASGKVEVEGLRFCDRKTIKLIKTASSSDRKVYRALCSTSDVSEMDIDTLRSMTYPIALKQRTPERVAHRRSDMVRDKTIHMVEIMSHSRDSIELRITAQGGAYIKEFISGDSGRTIPSISSVIGKAIVCTELDVLSVADHGLFE